MSTYGSPLNTTNMAPTGGLFGSQHRPEDNVGASDIDARNTPSKETQFGQPPNQVYPLLGYSYPPLQPPIAGAPQFYHPTPFNMTPTLQSSSRATQGYPSCGPSSQGYDVPQGGYGGCQMFPPQQFTGQGPSSPDASGVPLAPCGKIPVIRPTSSTSTPYGQIPGAPGRPPLASQRTDFSRLQKCSGQTLQGLRICPRYQ